MNPTVNQALSGNGCFRKYMFNRRRADQPNCSYFEKWGDAEQTLFAFTRWEIERMDFLRKSNPRFDINNMMQVFRTGEQWNQTYAAIRKIIAT